jgi:hypothetical protein
MPGPFAKHITLHHGTRTLRHCAPSATVRTMTDRQQRNFRVAFHMDDGSGVSQVFKRVFKVSVGF